MSYTSIVAPMLAGSRNLTSIAAVLIAVVALLAAVKQLPSSLRATQTRIAANAGLSPVARELDAARVYGVNQSLALRADELLPKDAVFYVATVGQPGSVAAPPFYAYWLLPRRHTEDLGLAQWVLSFGADPTQLAVGVDVVADLGGAQVLRVRR